MLARCALLGCLCASAVVAGPAVAHAEDAQALYDRGLEDMQRGRYESGCPALARSFELDPQPGAVFTLAACEARWGKLASAMRHYEAYLELHRAMTPAEQLEQRGRERVAREQKAALAPLVPEVTVTLAPRAPAGTVVTWDGAVVEAARLGVAMQVDPGEHVAGARHATGTREQRFVIAPGEKKHIALDPAPAAAPPVPKPVDDRAEAGSLRGWMLAAFGVGAAGLAVGAITGARAIDEGGKVDEECDAGDGVRRCSEKGLDAAERGQTLALVSTVAFAIGVVGAGAGVALLVLEPARGDPRPRGATLMVRGAW